MNKLCQRAFTLMEMLAVVVILGVILAIAIPSVRNIMNQNRSRMYQAHQSIIEAKTKLLIDHYKGEFFSSSSSCFQIDYQDLLIHDWIIEQDVHCEGSILLTKSGNQKDLSAKYYLSCFDNNHNSLHKADTIPSGCTLFKIS